MAFDFISYLLCLDVNIAVLYADQNIVTLDRYEVAERKMKKYIFENTVKQQADVLCYAFSPDLIDASEKELKEFLKVLCQYFPKTENGDGLFRPMDNQAYLNTFNNAYSNVVQLIEAKHTKKRHCQMFWLALLTLFILTITLGNDVYVQIAK